jgi:hypothetical protein
MKTIQIKFTVEVPKETTEEDLTAWLNFHLGVSPKIPMKNTLWENGLKVINWKYEKKNIQENNLE